MPVQGMTGTHVASTIGPSLALKKETPRRNAQLGRYTPLKEGYQAIMLGRLDNCLASGLHGPQG